jgi:putative DNA primase/helicase
MMNSNENKKQNSRNELQASKTEKENSCLKTKILDEVTLLSQGIDPVIKSTDDILQELSKSIQGIDFELLAFPGIDDLKKQIEELSEFVFNEDGSFIKENKLEQKKYNRLNKKLRSYKLTKNHYLILCVEQLLKIAKLNNWGLCKKNGCIYLYNGCFWSPIDRESFEYFLGGVSLKMGVEKFKAKIHTFKDELFKQFMADSYLPSPESKQKDVLINLENGTFKITPRERNLKGFDRNDFLTHQLPFEYDPNAQAPLFEQYLNEVLPDIEKQRVFSEYCGYIFVKPSVLKLEKLLILYGTGANGKSVFFEILNALLGANNISNYSLQSLTNDNGYFRAKIGNKLVNYASEINGKLETDVFKQMASGEPLEARLPYRDPFILKEYAKLIFNCNDLPRNVEHTNAFFRRFLIIGFDVTIPEEKQDKDLANKIIENELAGVFNWMLKGLDRILKQRNFSTCKAVSDARSNYEKESDSVKMFIEEHEYEKSKVHTRISVMYEAYKNFCYDDGFKPVNKSNFIKRLRHHKIVVHRISIGNVANVRTDKKDDLLDGF